MKGSESAVPDTPENEPESGSAPPNADRLLRTFSSQLGIDFDALVERAKEWTADNPPPADLGPEPFNVGQPRPPVD